MKITKIENVIKPYRPENVEVRECVVADLILAERITGKVEGFEFMSAVASQVCKFDGQAQPPEEVRKMTTRDFSRLVSELGMTDAAASPNTSSTSSEKENSENPTSSECLSQNSAIG